MPSNDDSIRRPYDAGIAHEALTCEYTGDQLTKTISEGTMNAQMKATRRKMFGTALLWVALAALVYTPASDGATSVIVACLGFYSFAAGLALFADGLERDIVERIRHGQGRS